MDLLHHAGNILRMVPLQRSHADIRPEVTVMETRTRTFHRMDNKRVRLHRLGHQDSGRIIADSDLADFGTHYAIYPNDFS